MGIGQRSFNVLNPQIEDTGNSAEHGRIHDRHGLSAKPMANGQTGGVKHRNIAAAELGLIRLRGCPRIDDNPAAWFLVRRNRRRSKNWVQNDDVIWIADLVVSRDFPIVDAYKCLDGRARTFSGVQSERLNMAPRSKIYSGNQLGERDAALSTSTVNDNFGHKSKPFSRF